MNPAQRDSLQRPLQIFHKTAAARTQATQGCGLTKIGCLLFQKHQLRRLLQPTNLNFAFQTATHLGLIRADLL